MQRIFTVTGVPPRVYKDLLTKEFGDAWLTWLPETLYTEIERVWHVAPSSEVANKLNAFRTFLSTDVFFTDAAAFEHIVQSINDVVVDPELLNLSTPAEILYALYMLGPVDTTKFGREVITYIRACCENFGILAYPPLLRFAQPEYSSPELKEALPKIRPALMAGADDDIVTQQSRKLYQIISDVVDRIGRFRNEVLETVNV